MNDTIVIMGYWTTDDEVDKITFLRDLVVARSLELHDIAIR